MNASPDMVTTAIKMLAALGVVLGGLFVVYYFTRRMTRTDAGGGKDKLIRILANKFIGVKKNICMVEVPGSILILGVTNDRITLLCEIEDDSVLDKIHHAETTGTTPSFSDHLNKIVSRIKSVRDD
jgi:flagellar biosynthetic protein FliO